MSETKRLLIGEETGGSAHLPECCPPPRFMYGFDSTYSDRL